MNIFDYIEEYDGDEVLSGKPATYKIKKGAKWSTGFNDGEKPKGSKGKQSKRKSNSYKNTKAISELNDV